MMMMEENCLIGGVAHYSESQVSSKQNVSHYRPASDAIQRFAGGPIVARDWMLAELNVMLSACCFKRTVFSTCSISL